MSVSPLPENWFRPGLVATPPAMERHRYGVLQFDGESSPVRGVYFVCCQGFVKIGHAKDIRKRISGIAQMNPHRVWLRAYINTDSEAESRRLEAELHERFKDDRYRLEWFHYTDRIRSFVDGL
jgi:hypothetical protein